MFLASGLAFPLQHDCSLWSHSRYALEMRHSSVFDGPSVGGWKSWFWVVPSSVSRKTIHIRPATPQLHSMRPGAWTSITRSSCLGLCRCIRLKNSEVKRTRREVNLNYRTFQMPFPSVTTSQIKHEPLEGTSSVGRSYSASTSVSPAVDQVHGSAETSPRSTSRFDRESFRRTGWSH